MKVIAVSGWAKSGKDTVTNYLLNKHKFTRVAFADPLKEMVAANYNIPLESLHVQEQKEVPLLQYPVTPKDKFALHVSKFMFKEFRSSDGRIPMEAYEDPSGALLGLMSYNQAFGAPDVAQLYHTPRSLAILEGSTKRTANSNYWVDKAINDIRRLRINAPLTSSISNTTVKTGGVIISDLRYRSEIEPVKTAFGKDALTIRINRFDTTESVDPSERDLDNYPFDMVIDNKGTLEELFEKVDKCLE